LNSLHEIYHAVAQMNTKQTVLAIWLLQLQVAGGQVV